MDWLLIATLLLVVPAVALSLLLTLQTWEFARFARSRVAHPKVLVPLQRVTLFAPCKGLEPGLKDNLRPLFEQDYTGYQLVLIVESKEDPATGPIRELISEYPAAGARLVVAGRAISSGQKVHNLLSATADLGDAEILAFVDSDARPQRTWLRQLVQHLQPGRAAAATGYRWFVPTSNSLPNLLLHSINASVAALVGPGKHHLVWGGAWAIRREVFEAINLRHHWQGTLSDDLVAARELARNGNKLEFEPACMTASASAMDWGGLLEFVRRQYMVARFYSPRWWLLGLVACTVSQLVFWGSCIAAGIAIVQRADWLWIPSLTVASLYVTYVARALIRQRAARAFLPQQVRQLRVACWFDIALGPLAALVNWRALLGSLWGHRITWRGITYAIHGGGKVRIIERADPLAEATRPFHPLPLRQAG